jgi:hypothetical protein
MNIKTNIKNQNVELGKVTWLRDYDEALQKSSATGKPVLLFFQEIPGCSTCVNYGRDVLSHPLMVEAIENEFIPLAIFNNRPGKDAGILKQYNEPSWNNPVTYFVDAKGIDIIPKLANSYHPLSMYRKMVEVIQKVQGKIPRYLETLGDDLKLNYGHTEETIYETPCFWSGETSLAQHPAVITTLSGWIHGKEVVKVHYDPEKGILKDLNNYAFEQRFFLIDNHEAFVEDKNPQYYLKQSNFSFLPLSIAQRTKINHAIPYKLNPEEYLSPKQNSWLNDKSKMDFFENRNVYLKDIVASWDLFNN